VQPGRRREGAASPGATLLSALGSQNCKRVRLPLLSRPGRDISAIIVEIRGLARAMANVHIEDTSKSIVKLIDEYNYARFTKAWI